MNKPKSHIVVERQCWPRNCDGPLVCRVCGQPLGGTHTPQCLHPERTVLIRATIEYVVAESACDSIADIEKYRNNSNYCKSSIIDEILDLGRRNICLCDAVKFEVVREATERDEADVGWDCTDCSDWNEYIDGFKDRM